MGGVGRPAGSCQSGIGGKEETDQQVQALAQQLAAKQGVDALVIDEIVYDVASKNASKVNNGGAEAQAAFLVEQLGYTGALELINEYS
jgi:hypothetical protein